MELVIVILLLLTVIIPDQVTIAIRTGPYQTQIKETARWTFSSTWTKNKQFNKTINVNLLGFHTPISPLQTINLSAQLKNPPKSQNSP